MFTYSCIYWPHLPFLHHTSHPQTFLWSSIRTGVSITWFAFHVRCVDAVDSVALGCGGGCMYLTTTKLFYLQNSPCHCLCFPWKARWQGFSECIFSFSAICIFFSVPHWQLYSTVQRQLLSFPEQSHPCEITQGRQAYRDRFQPPKGCNKSQCGRRKT